jgi:hypothetical protein
MGRAARASTKVTPEEKYMKEKLRIRSRRHGWATLEVNVLLGDNTLEEYKAFAKSHGIKWSDFVSWALRNMFCQIRDEDRKVVREVRLGLFPGVANKMDAKAGQLN